MAKKFPTIRCSVVTVETIKGIETYLVPSESGGHAVAEFNRPDAIVKASGNHRLKPVNVGEVGTCFEFDLAGKSYVLEPGSPGYDRTRAVYASLIDDIEQLEQDKYDH